MYRHEPIAPAASAPGVGALQRLLVDVKRRAYELYRDRVAAGGAGDEVEDWKTAELEVLGAAGLLESFPPGPLERSGSSPDLDLEQPGEGGGERGGRQGGERSGGERDGNAFAGFGAAGPGFPAPGSAFPPSMGSNARRAAVAPGSPTARDVMTRRVAAVGPDCTLGQLACALDERGISAVPVVDERQRLLGIVTVTDLVHCAAVADQSAGRMVQHPPQNRFDLERGRVAGEILAGARVGEVCSRALVVAPPDASLLELAALMVDRGIHQVLIVEENRIAGIVTALDLVKALYRRGPDRGTPMAGL